MQITTNVFFIFFIDKKIKNDLVKLILRGEPLRLFLEQLELAALEQLLFFEQLKIFFKQRTPS